MINFVFLVCALLVPSVLGQNFSSCDTNSSPEYTCNNEDGSPRNCRTYAVLRANSRYSSLLNVSSYFGISELELAEANTGFSADTGAFLSNDQPVLIPIECKCSSQLFEAEVRRISGKAESFYRIAESLEGLTSCKAVREKNPNAPPGDFEEGIGLVVPLKCACPVEDSTVGKFLLSYPVKEGDTLSGLALEFNVTVESLVSINGKYSRTGFKPENDLEPFSTLLIPVEDKPVFGILPKAEEPDLSHPSASIQVKESQKRTERRMLMIGVYVAAGVIGLLAFLAVGAAFYYVQWKRNRQGFVKNDDVELHHLSLSIRTTSDKKVSFDGSQYNFDDPSDTATPHKMPVENYSVEELQKATEDFSLSNLIEGNVYHGRLKGKNLAIKRVPSEVMSKLDYLLFHERVHRHRNLIRFMGTCLTEGPNAYVVYEYAKNGSLKDWIHGGLAIKSHFIASCNCFLNWSQRITICLDIAIAMQYMHHLSPSYVHRNIRSRNIFLDEDFNAKLGNFGMAKCVDHESLDQDFHPGEPATWNKGYLAPEFLEKGEVSTGIDVFAYGVALLEVLSGKSPILQDDDVEEGNLLTLSDEIKEILQLEDAEELREWMDSALCECYSFDGAVMLANLARSCVEDDPCSRPTAGEIVEKLSRLVEEQPDLGDQFLASESSCKPLVKAV